MRSGEACSQVVYIYLSTTYPIPPTYSSLSISLQKCSSFSRYIHTYIHYITFLLLLIPKHFSHCWVPCIIPHHIATIHTYTHTLFVCLYHQVWHSSLYLLTSNIKHFCIIAFHYLPTYKTKGFISYRQNGSSKRRWGGERYVLYIS